MSTADGIVAASYAELGEYAADAAAYTVDTQSEVRGDALVCFGAEVAEYGLLTDGQVGLCGHPVAAHRKYAFCRCSERRVSLPVGKAFKNGPGPLTRTHERARIVRLRIKR